MIKPDNSKLDNPVWHSLSEAHQRFSIKYDGMKFYHPDYCPFGGCIMTKNVSKDVADYSKLTSNFFVVGDKPEIPNLLKLKKELVCLQMIINEKIDTEIKDDIIALSNDHTETLFELVTLVQPGYFKNKTALLSELSKIRSRIIRSVACLPNIIAL